MICIFKIVSYMVKLLFILHILSKNLLSHKDIDLSIMVAQSERLGYNVQVNF